MIIRRKHTSNYTIVPNALAGDTRISVEARWCLWYLLTKPDNWELIPDDIKAASGGWGRDKTYRVIRELIDAGWIKRSLVHDGRIQGMEYLVTDSQFPEKPETDVGRQFPENQYPENQDHNNKGQGTSTDQGGEARASAPPGRPKESPLASSAVAAHQGAVGGLLMSEPTVNTKRRTKVPLDFAPNERNIEKAVQAGIAREDVPEAVELFVAYWQGRGDPMADWQATFRNSLPILANQLRRTRHGRNTNSQGPQRAQPAGEATTLRERFERIRRAIREESEALGP